MHNCTDDSRSWSDELMRQNNHRYLFLVLLLFVPVLTPTRLPMRINVHSDDLAQMEEPDATSLLNALRSEGFESIYLIYLEYLPTIRIMDNLLSSTGSFAATGWRTDPD